MNLYHDDLSDFMWLFVYKMTVKNRKEAECATASEDMEIDNNILETEPVYNGENEENLLGRVLAGNINNLFVYFRFNI